ncbi:ACP S-malonyltransferase [Petralouisia muris]|jgi:[acyl-carrier-protein] S-malonyltransferase|uniref:ACP S-malonyltransferase n=1 Tax=Petralouisia muris TaxID=3032872 RepID=A0AC61RYM0_9FIRM|nr:ACP S-malonyltransferase [Petralouisia muris]TGY96866.1 ACP S-malonyltransferase [Petralouisia muris]
MRKIAFIFPGQGAQYTGMGRDFYENFDRAKEVFAIAGKVSGMAMEELIFRENDNLHITKYTQIAMLTVELAILRVLEEKGVTSSVNAGLSLGEYAALTASGGLSMRDALELVVKRGKFMQEAVPTGGAMTAVMGLDANTVETICEETEGIVSVANYNCPGQIVISGEEKAVNKAAEKMKEAGAKRCMPLNVSGPFHSRMLEEAGKKLADELEHVSIGELTTPYISNVTAEYVLDKEDVKGLLEQQISSSVRWQQSVELMAAEGVDTFIEIGPKKTLSGFLKKIAPQLDSYHVETVEDMEKLLEILKVDVK